MTEIPEELVEQVDNLGLRLFAAWCGTTPEHAATRDAWVKGQASKHTRAGWERVAGASREAAEQALAEAKDEIQERIRAAVEAQKERDAKAIRDNCPACEGTGHADAETECEYCGRPIAAIRAQQPERKKPPAGGG